jgi:hypothetical protein
MKKTRTNILAGVVLLAAVLLITGIVWGKATKTPIAGAMTVTVSGPPSRFWRDHQGVAHYRGLPAVLDFTSGDLVGTGSTVVNVNFDPATGNGDESGAAMLVNVTWGGLIGTLEGRQNGTYTSGVCTGTAVYHGVSGDFEGMKMTMSYSHLLSDVGFDATYTAIVLDPHGE